MVARISRPVWRLSDAGWEVRVQTGDADYQWTNEHKDLRPDQFPDANPNRLGTQGLNHYVADAGANLIAKVDRHGKVSTLAYLQVPAGSTTDGVPPSAAVPSLLAMEADGQCPW
jgi:hypothetical protein